MPDQQDFLASFIAENTVPQHEVEHFRSIDWINQWMQNPAYELIPTFSRVLKPSGEDYFFAKTLSTSSTLPCYLTLRLRDLKTPPETRPGEKASNPPNHKQVSLAPDQPDTITLLALGQPGCDGHPGVLHGGMTSALLDETMGLMMILHSSQVISKDSRDPLFTVNLNINYRAPIPTGGEVIVKTWMTKRESRKWLCKAQIVDKAGRVLSDADGIFVFVKNKL